MVELAMIFSILLGPLGLAFMLAAIRYHTTGVPVSQLWKPFALGSAVGLLGFITFALLLVYGFMAIGFLAALAAGIASGWLLRNSPRTWSAAGLFAATASLACMGAVTIWVAIGTKSAPPTSDPGDFVFAAFMGAFGVWLTPFPLLLFTAAITIYIFRPEPAGPAPTPHAGPA
ncbi:hypothetical protein [Corynebacterium sp. CCUG 70398]|uniref:hypothetical protein n=1 Tax=Corynebacterium sp. CCUG 70398 TaxID=2823891 RepID=UPI00210D4FCC|nr:hypothetical protein [Corynebacterium sp. CCUG 70398]MCQ4623944.1 hypothetical protein [Corynebacterium sp. CCUG 70398]